MTRLPVEERRAALVDAALRVMVRNGLAAGTTRAIVSEAGMSLASFHYAFASRDDLLRELVRGVVGREFAAATSGMPADAGLLGCLRHAAAGYLEHLAREPGHEQLMLELTMHALRSPTLRPLAREQYRAYTEAATHLLDQVAELTGEQWARPVPELARLLITLVDGATTTWLVDRDTAATRAVLDAGIEAFVAGAAVRPA
ncbi:TetR/AcrR family transcriptional regulator [Blastococcus haudaquaticus]|uniref:Transcriptional regulator, TetR family n=1 Tax=Blastococcus haudaquaticus TaxID=1938745 RepID=A0A286H8J1_9ACTN|nr:TetR family transcriptional regulator [Blastococcus haudaquaticus]SOE04120.1 transcriptional regulator, TetR family [Blastococcus haudaquaticus]